MTWSLTKNSIQRRCRTSWEGGAVVAIITAATVAAAAVVVLTIIAAIAGLSAGVL